MNGLRIYPSSYIKYLGVYLDASLNGNHHCNLLVRKLKRANDILSKATHYVPSEEPLSIYHAIFSSHLAYGCQMWGQSINIFTKKVFKLQNRAMRILSFADFDANADPLYKILLIQKALSWAVFTYPFLQLQNMDLIPSLVNVVIVGISLQKSSIAIYLH